MSAWGPPCFLLQWQWTKPLNCEKAPQINIFIRVAMFIVSLHRNKNLTTTAAIDKEQVSGKDNSESIKVGKAVKQHSVERAAKSEELAVCSPGVRGASSRELPSFWEHQAPGSGCRLCFFYFLLILPWFRFISLFLVSPFHRSAFVNDLVSKLFNKATMNYSISSILQLLRLMVESVSLGTCKYSPATLEHQTLLHYGPDTETALGICSTVASQQCNSSM